MLILWSILYVLLYILKILRPPKGYNHDWNRFCWNYSDSLIFKGMEVVFTAQIFNVKTSMLTEKYLQFSALISLINDPAGRSGYLWIIMMIFAGYEAAEGPLELLLCVLIVFLPLLCHNKYEEIYNLRFKGACRDTCSLVTCPLL